MGPRERSCPNDGRWPVLSLLVLVVCLIAPLAPLPGASAQTRLDLVSTPWPPFTGEPGMARVALDLVHTALDRIGIAAETTIVEESGLTGSLLSGDFDGSAALWRDDEREAALLYSEPYLENRLVLVGRTGSDVSASSLDALEGRSVAIVEGYSYGESVSGGTRQPTWVLTSGLEDSVRRVLDGDVEYALIDEFVIDYIVKNHGAEAQARLRFGSSPLITRTLHLAIQRTLPDAESIIDRFNGELKTMVADGSFHDILQTDWLVADVDGDGVSEYVPASDQAGPNPPERAYRLILPRPAQGIVPPPPQRFFLGGRVYQGWGTVPDRYKVAAPYDPADRGTTITLFTFTW